MCRLKPGAAGQIWEVNNTSQASEESTLMTKQWDINTTTSYNYTHLRDMGCKVIWEDTGCPLFRPWLQEHSAPRKRCSIRDILLFPFLVSCLSLGLVWVTWQGKLLFSSQRNWFHLQQSTPSVKTKRTQRQCREGQGTRNWVGRKDDLEELVKVK